MEDIARAFAHNLRLIERQVAGISDEASVGTGGHGINSLNWILGHIAQSRDRLLVRLGAAPELGDGAFARYDMGADAVTEVGPDVLGVEEALDHLRRQLPRLQATLDALTAEELAAEVEGSNGDLRYLILRFLMHDSFHTGQTDVLGRIVEEPT
jgi:hypothetical protein